MMAVVMIFVCCGCQGNFGKVSLQDAIEIPADGMIMKNIVQQIKNENAIGNFYGESNGFKYEWTIFGDDISTVEDINLLVDVNQTEGKEINVTLAQKEAFGFPALLSLQWIFRFLR